VDGKDAPEAIVLEAIGRGFDSLGFSEHSDLSKYSSYPNQLTPEKAVLYRKEIRALAKKYEGTIDIFCGLEFDFYSEDETDAYDYLIGSVHYLDCGKKIATFDNGLDSTRDYVNDYFGGNGLAFAKKYFETVARLPERKSFDIIGHFDLASKNNDAGKFFDASSHEYLNYGLEAIHALCGKIPFFEVNTGAIARGYKALPYPAMDFLREFKALGFGAIITSDCHNKDYLDCNFGEAREILSAAGFGSRWIFTKDGFKEVVL
jgi:histidinol-phosphatase (PHP family)